ncbi:MAG: vWA domain-containing protein [Pirellulaceae bacterium]|nr:vWA domain-containing protein [Pirellulaceae bacterium]
MKLNCVYCGKLFSISAEQLGGQGKCPHCHEIVFLPKADQPAPASELAPLTKSISGHYFVAVLFAVVLHVLFLVGLGLMVWGGNDAFYSNEGVRINIGRPVETRVAESVSETTAFAVADAVDVSPQQLQEALTQWQLAALQPSSPVAAATSQLVESQPLSEWLTPNDSLAANLNEDFGALLERLKRDGLDLVITFDSTGSMTGEINQVKRQIHRIGRTLMEMIPQTRISICTYRDKGDEYVVKGLPLTRNLDQVQLYLNEITAGGGGDEPEAVEQGLRWSIEQNQFLPNSRKVILLFGDAPPHAASMDEIIKLSAGFRQRQGGVISTVTCRSPNRLQAFELISQHGGGEAFLTQNEREIVSQLMVLVFGSQHQEKVLEAFKLLQP